MAPCIEIATFKIVDALFSSWTGMKILSWVLVGLGAHLSGDPLSNNGIFAILLGRWRNFISGL